MKINSRKPTLDEIYGQIYTSAPQPTNQINWITVATCAGVSFVIVLVAGVWIIHTINEHTDKVYARNRVIPPPHQPNPTPPVTVTPVQNLPSESKPDAQGEVQLHVPKTNKHENSTKKS